MALLAVLVAGCGGGGGQSIVGQWEYQDTATAFAEALRFDADGTYEQVKLWATSASTGDAEKETGTYTADGSTFTVTPATSTCPALDQAATYAYSFSGGELVVSAAAGVTTFAPLTGTPTGTVSISYGCNENGTWVPAQ